MHSRLGADMTLHDLLAALQTGNLGVSGLLLVYAYMQRQDYKRLEQKLDETQAKLEDCLQGNRENKAAIQRMQAWRTTEQPRGKPWRSSMDEDGGQPL